MFLRRQKLSLYHKVKKPLHRGKGYHRVWHYLVWRIKRLPGTPQYIATGLAIGVGINFWPILFTHLVFGYLLCRILKGSVIAMFMGTLLGNPWTFAIVYPIMYRIGKVLLGFHAFHPSQPNDVVRSVESVWDQIWPIESWGKLAIVFQELLFPMMLGGFLLGLPCVLFTYYLTRKTLRVYQEQKRKNLLAKFHKVEQEIEHQEHAQ